MNNFKLVCEVIREGLDLDVLGINGWIVLYEVSFCGYLEIIIVFFEGGVNLNI